MVSENQRECAEGQAPGRSAGAEVVGSATFYADMGWLPIPVPVGKKGPRLPAWQDLRLTRDEVPSHFSNGGNLGLLLGEPSGWLVDVDLDSPEARALAAAFLPDTGMQHGRCGSPLSHWWYVSQGAKTLKLADTNSDGDTMLLELRSTGGQTLVPPSTHPSGETLGWVGEFAPAEVSAETLRAACLRLAAAALFMRHWQAGQKHDTILHLAGFLARREFSIEEAKAFVKAVSDATGDDTAKCLRDIEDSYRKVAAGEPATGGPELARAIGKDVMDCLVEWLGLRDGQASAERAGEPPGGLTSLPTIDKGVGSEVAQAGQLRGISLAALRRKARDVGVEPDALPLLGEAEPPIFRRRLSHIVAAPPKAGKTTLLYAQAKEWAGIGVSILFMSEEPEVVWYRRLAAEDAEDEVLERIKLLPALGESPESLLERMGQGPEEIVILDTAKILGVEDENDAATVNRVITPWVVKSRATGKTLIVAHHMRKGGGRAVEALAGSYSWAAVFDTVIEIELDEQDSRRQLRAVGRLLPSCKLLYELRDGGLVLLGAPEQVELEAAKERALEALTGDWQTTAQVHETLGDPRPSQEQLRKALNALAAGGKIERDPPWSEGPKQGVAYRWRAGQPPSTSLPTASSLVGSEVEGTPQGSLPLPPATGGQ